MLVQQNKAEAILGNMKFINKLYNIVRIVDPNESKVLNYQDNKIIPEESRCYSFWKRDSICENCISHRAIEEQDVFAKIEYREDQVYMVLSIPMELDNKKVALELLRDITQERILFESVDDSKSEPYKLFNNRKENIIKDSVTKIFNNRYINERLPYDIIKGHTEEEYLSLIMINIDNFKGINNKYGYDFGNIILREFATILKEKMDIENAWIARYTNDIFMIVLNDYSPSQAKKLGEDLRKIIENHKFYSVDDPITLTSSIGIYTEEIPSSTMEDLIERAENLLKIAKEKGKNCIITSGEEIQERIGSS